MNDLKHQLKSAEEYVEFNSYDAHKYVYLDPKLAGLRIINSPRVLSVESIKFFTEIKTKPVFKRAESSIEVILEKANHHAGYKLFSDKVTSEEVWYEKDYVLHHSYLINDPNQGNLESWNWIIDSSTGAILSTFPAKIYERGIVFPPNQIPQFGTTPPEKEVADLIQWNGTSIKGTDFQSTNTCFAYKCNNSTNGNCSIDDSVCVDILDGMVEGQDYFSAQILFRVNGRELDFNYDWEANGYIDNLVIMGWKNAAIGSSRLKKPDNGIWGSDTDFTTLTGREQTDSIAELQGYEWLTRHAAFMRNLLENDSFCFAGSGINCRINGTTASNSDEKFRFFVNYNTLKAYPDPNSSNPDFITQIKKQGRGKNADDPVWFYEHQSYSDAYFSKRINNPETEILCADGCLTIDNYPFPHMVFGQSQQFDWALNECIVYHELNHALVGQFIPTLPSYRWTDNGLRSDPGAMNEGWADYFAAINCGISDFRRTYNRSPNRNINADITCKDTVGEVHADSILFSGALWRIRNEIIKFNGYSTEDQISFDKIVLEAMSLGTADELFDSQFQKILQLLSSHSRLNVIYTFAEEIFDKKIFSCERYTDFTEKSDPTFVLPHSAISASNFSTIPTTLLFKPRASDWKAVLMWRQWTLNPWLGPLDVGYGQSRLKMVVSDCPIKFKGTIQSNITGFSNCNGEEIDLNWEYSNYKSLYGYFNFEIKGSTEKYIVIGNEMPATLYLYSSSVRYIGFNLIWAFTFMGLGSLCSILLVVHGFYIFKAKKSTHYEGVFLLALVFGVMSFCASLLGYIFGIVREYSYIAMFTFWIFAIIASNWALIGSSFSADNSGWLKFNLSGIILTGFGLIIVLLRNSTVIFHSIIYTMFIVVQISTLLSWIKYISRSYSRPTEAQLVTEVGMIQMDSLSRI